MAGNTSCISLQNLLLSKIFHGCIFSLVVLDIRLRVFRTLLPGYGNYIRTLIQFDIELPREQGSAFLFPSRWYI
jgi:hypothetical protein